MLGARAALHSAGVEYTPSEDPYALGILGMDHSVHNSPTVDVHGFIATQRDQSSVMDSRSKESHARIVRSDTICLEGVHKKVEGAMNIINFDNNCARFGQHKADAISCDPGIDSTSEWSHRDTLDRSL